MADGHLQLVPSPPPGTTDIAMELEPPLPRIRSPVAEEGLHKPDPPASASALLSNAVVIVFELLNLAPFDWCRCVLSSRAPASPPCQNPRLVAGNGAAMLGPACSQPRRTGSPPLHRAGAPDLFAELTLCFAMSARAGL